MEHEEWCNLIPEWILSQCLCVHCVSPLTKTNRKASSANLQFYHCSFFFCLLVHYKTKWETNESINSPKYFFFFVAFTLDGNVMFWWIMTCCWMVKERSLSCQHFCAGLKSGQCAVLVFVFFSVSSIIQGCCSSRAKTEDVEQTSTLSKNKKKEYLMNKGVRRAVYSNASLPSCG